MFVTVFAAVGCALGLLLLALGVVALLAPSPQWSMVVAGGLLLVSPGVGALVVHEVNAPLVRGT